MARGSNRETRAVSHSHFHQTTRHSSDQHSTRCRGVGCSHRRADEIARAVVLSLREPEERDRSKKRRGGGTGLVMESDFNGSWCMEYARLLLDPTRTTWTITLIASSNEEGVCENERDR